MYYDEKAMAYRIGYEQGFNDAMNRVLAHLNEFTEVIGSELSQEMGSVEQSAETPLTTA